MPQIQFGREAYKSRSRFLNGERLVNMYLEEAPSGSKNATVVYGTAGLKLFDTIGSDPVYGHHLMGDFLYVVSGNTVYKVGQFGEATSLGTIGSVNDNVIMDNNGTQVIINKEDGASYVATTSTLTQITDSDYQSSSSVAVLDGYAIFTKLNSNEYFISSLNDATAFDALDRSEAKSKPDNLVRAYVHQDSLWLFKETNTEVHRNTGNSDFPFEIISGATIDRGCAAKRSVVSEDNTIFWLGDDLVVYRADGYTPKRISTHAIEGDIASYNTTSDAEAFVYTEHGHKFLVLTFPTAKRTWVYDIATGLWHQRQSFEKERWRCTGLVKAFGKNITGDFETGLLYEIDLDTYTENGSTIQRIVTSPPIWNDTKRMVFHKLRIDFDPGVGLISGQGSDPQAMLRFSNDGGGTWSNEIWKDIGQMGEYKTRAVWRRLGQARQRIFEVTVSDQVKVAITGAYVEVSTEDD